MKQTVPKKRVSTILLRAILSVYFIVVCIVTTIQLAVEYRQTKNDVLRELREVETIFSESLITALWSANNAQVDALVNGIIRLPFVTGIEIANRKSGLDVRKFLTRESDLFYRFNLVYTFEENRLYLASIKVYSDHPVVFDRVKVGFLLLLFSALIRSAILTALFVWAVNKYLNRPLTRLVNLVEKVNVEKIDATHFDFNAEKSIELHQLYNVFQKMNFEIAEHVEDITKAREMYQNILDNVRAGVFRIDDEGNLLTANHAMAKIAGYKNEEELRRSTGSLKELIKTPEYITIMKEIKMNGRIKSETAIKSRMGETIICELSAYRIESVDGKSDLIEGMLQDLSERKAKENALREKQLAQAANQAKSEFLANMSHELRTPLNGILGYAQILERHRDMNETAIKDGLAIIYQSGSHLLTLINDILDLSKIEARKMELLPGEIHLLDFLDGIVGIIRMRAQQKDIRLVHEFDEALPAGIESDEKRLRQVLLNLLGNAVKFTGKGGSVTFQVTCVGHEKLRFSISDTGIGMTPEQMGKIFDPFEQVGDASQRVEGTGLGLAISRQLVELMGGELLVASEFGKGSTFWFETLFPETAVPVVEKPLRKGIITGYAGPGRSVLVVDDKRDNRLVLLNLLEPAGFEVTLAENGREGVDKASVIQPDIILMDLVMPVMNGFEAIKKIRRMPDLMETPILAVSASAFGMDREQSLKTGCQGFLPKPVNARQLFDFLETHLRLEWIYEDSPVEEAEPAMPIAEAELVPPPQEELEVLYELAMFGSMNLIRERARHLETLGDQYRPFAKTLRHLAREIEDRQILALIEQFMDLKS